MEKQNDLLVYLLTIITSVDTSGFTVNDFITLQRINRAKYLLIQTNKNLSEICQEIGLNDTSYFCKLFKRKAGYSPVQYRKIIR